MRMKIQRLPFSIFLCLRLLQIFTAHTDNIMAATKNKTLPTTPAVIARDPFILPLVSVFFKEFWFVPEKKTTTTMENEIVNE